MCRTGAFAWDDRVGARVPADLGGVMLRVAGNLLEKQTFMIKT